MIKEYEPLIRSVLRNTPSHLRDDCYQAACVGLLNAINNKNKTQNFRAYAYICMKSEVLNEIATLLHPMALDKTTFMMLCKYNKIKNNAGNISDMRIAKAREKNLENLSNLSRISLQAADI